MQSNRSHTQPDVRLQKIYFKDFMNIHESEIIINYERKNSLKDIESNIMGVYGQNGSGKSAVIKAIDLLKTAMSGQHIHESFADCVAHGKKYADLSFVFDFDYNDEYPFSRTITYSFKLLTVPNLDAPKSEYFHYKRKAEIVNETIAASGYFNNEAQKKQVILTMDTGKYYPIGPVRKINEFLGDNKEVVKAELKKYRMDALKERKSFFFFEQTMELFKNNSNNSEYFQVLLELQNYAKKKLFVIDIQLGASAHIVINTQNGPVYLDLVDIPEFWMHTTEKEYELLVDYFKAINEVLPTLIPELQIKLKRKTEKKDNKKNYKVSIFSKRGKTIMPLRYESAGVLKLISVLSLLVAVYNDSAITVAIDELDAGIYEYLLGEILMGLEKYGKGQLIFTSHNLRPLEVLRKESLVFTTTNPDNRFIRLKGVGKTNNLRSLYLREILEDSQDEKIYDAAKRQRMIASFIKAGEIAKEFVYSLDKAGENDD